MKALREISWQVDEPTYREDAALSYSTLAKFAREGFHKLNTLFDKVESPSLLFGSAVDALITGGQEEFDSNFFVADFPETPETIVKIVKDCFREFSTTHRNLSDIPDIEVIGRAANYAYQNNWKPETRAKVIKEKGEEYYRLLYIAGSKKILDTATKELVDNAVEALKTSNATKFFFAEDNPFDNRYERYYQLKFKSTIDGIDFRCMADLVLVDHQDKVIYPVDLKTSSHFEDEFYKSFIQWRYDIQAKLYWRIINDNIKKDDYFKQFTLADYQFIVVNKESLTPLVWQFFDTKTEGTLIYGKHKNIELKDPIEIAKELKYYLDNDCKIPLGIKENEPNNIIEYLNQI